MVVRYRYRQESHHVLADTIAALTAVGSIVFWSSSDGPVSAPFGSAFYQRLREVYGFDIEGIDEDPAVVSAREVSGWTTGNWARIYTDPATGEATSRTSVHVMKMVRKRLRGASASTFSRQ